LWCTAAFGLCACYPSPAHLKCLDGCNAENDRCVLAAQDAPAVQSCDEAVQLCLARCPP
jgi:hypothetical protein